MPQNILKKMNTKECKRILRNISIAATKDDIKALKYYCKLTKDIRSLYEKDKHDLNETDRIKVVQTFGL